MCNQNELHRHVSRGGNCHCTLAVVTVEIYGEQEETVGSVIAPFLKGGAVVVGGVLYVTWLATGLLYRATKFLLGLTWSGVKAMGRMVKLVAIKMKRSKQKNDDTEIFVVARQLAPSPQPVKMLSQKEAPVIAEWRVVEEYEHVS